LLPLVAHYGKTIKAKEDPLGESGWMLSGSIAGGMTVWSDDRWPQYYLDTLSNPYSEPPNLDPASANYIQKITSDDLQQGTVGMLLSRPLQVKVMDHAWHPVPNVNVTFTVKAGGGSFSDGTTVKTAETNAQGIASVPFIAGKYTKDNPVFWWYDNHLTQPYPEQVGENLVDAYITSTRAPITTPFAVYGFPKTDSPYRVKNLHGDGLANSILFLSGFVSLIAEDAYGNPKSNIPLSFKLNDAEINSTPPNCSNPAYAQSSKKSYFIRLSEACVFQAPVWGTCADTQEQTVDMPSNHLGAQLEVMLGGVPDAKYKIEAACSPGAACRYYEYTCPQGQPCDYLDNGEPMLTYTHYTHYHCGESQLYLEAFYITDVYGYLKNAQKVVDPPTAPLTIPVMAKLYAIQNGHIVTDLESASVMFNNIASTVQSNGTYTANVPITIVGLNQIKIEGKATVDGTVKNAGPFNFPVYGVKINADPIPIIVTDEQGYTVQDTEIKYTILPAVPDPQPYRAMSAAVHIFKSEGGNDVLIETIRTETTGAGKATIGRGFKFDLGRTYKVQVVLNYGSGIEMRGERITLRYNDLYIEKEDEEFPTVTLRWNDYYPALGTKKIIVRGFESGGIPLNNVNVSFQVLVPVPSLGVSLTPSIASFTNGRAEFQISAIGLAPPLNNDPATGGNELKIKFFLLSPDGQPLGDIQETWYVKNNSNTSLKEVLDGTAVFVYDTATGDNHKGKTTSNAHKNCELDYVQMMINHIIPPLATPVKEENLRNTLWVDGVYGDNTKKAIEVLTTGGGMTFTDNNNRQFTITLVDDLKIRHRVAETDVNAPNILKKLARDYSGLDQNNLTEERGKVIDKDVLVGLNKSYADHHPIDHDDVGILELYENDDWDGDGISNYIEVENSSTHTDNSTVQVLFNPLAPDTSEAARKLLRSFSRGSYGIKAVRDTDTQQFLHFSSIGPGNISTPLQQNNYSQVEVSDGLRAPDVSRGYYYFWGADAEDSDNYANSDVIRILDAIGKEWDEKYPYLPLHKDAFERKDGLDNVTTAADDANIFPEGNRFGVHDLSRKGGVTRTNVAYSSYADWYNNDWNDHITHENGLDIDVRYMSTLNPEDSGWLVRRERRINFNNNTRDYYDKALTYELMKLFVQHGATTIYVDQTGRSGIVQLISGNTTATVATLTVGSMSATVRQAAEHHHHFHVAFERPYKPSGAINFTPVWNNAARVYEVTTDVIRDSLNLPLLWNTALNITARNEIGTLITTSVISFNDIWTGGGGVINDIRPSDMAGYQIATDNEGRLRFMVQKPVSGNTVTVTIGSVIGTATGTVSLDFTGL
jgi:hypothetical protein